MIGFFAIGLVLMSFALLETVFDFCVGCIVYTSVVFPLLGKRQNEAFEE